MQTLATLPSTCAAMAALAEAYPLLATPLSAMPAEEDGDVDAILTDGKTVFVNPGFIAARTEAGRVYMLAFIGMSVMELFIDRVGGRNPKVWGLASNMSVHLQLDEIGVPGRPPESDGLFDPALRGLVADEIYERLLDGSVKAFGMDISDVVSGGPVPLPADA